MLLTRMRTNLARQNWAAVTMDIIVVIAGILIAFQIERWAESRRDRQLEQEYLLRLKADLYLELQSMQSALEYAGDRIRAARLLESTARAADIDSEVSRRLPWAVETVSWRSFPQITAFVYEEMKSSGNLSLIRSAPLRMALAEHYNRLEHESRVGLDMSAQHRYEQYSDGLLTMDELIAVEQGAWTETEDWISVERAEELATAIRHNRPAIAVLPSLAQHHTFNIKIIEAAQQRVNNLIEMIESLEDQP
jgi:hypothetical protein